MNKQTNTYRGKVNITFKRNGRTLKKVTHNTGLQDMALLFAKAITGNLSISEDIPRLIDIGYVVPSASDLSFTYDNGVWMSILNAPVTIGGRQYRFDNVLNNWVGVLTSTIYYSDLNGGILDDVLTDADSGVIQLKVRLCSYEVKGRKYLAEIDITPDEIREIKDATSAIFNWYTELLYAEDASSTTIVTDIN